MSPGDLLAGKYRIERVLGQGGMGVVVAAIHEALDERVALKFLLPEALTNQEAVARFTREARAAVKIRSEYVARVTDVGTLESGSPYMVMEYLQGADLSQYLERTGPLPIEEAIEYVLQACEALAEAHSLGIVHRDLKPANLFRIVRPDGTPAIKLLDFGISKLTSANQSMTQTSSMMGSPLYMAPEQMTSAKHVDMRADIWAVGVILHELLTAQVPFGGDTLPELCAKILTEEPPPLRQLRPDAPQALEQVLLTCLRKNRDERYPNIAALAADLRPFAPARAQHSVDRVSRVLGVTASPEPAPTAAPAEALTSEHQEARALTQGAWGKTQSGSGRRSSFGAALVAIALLVAGGATATLLVMRSKSEPPNTAPPAGAESSQVAVEGAAAPTPAPEPSAVVTAQTQVEPATDPTPPAEAPEPEVTPSKAAAAVATAAPAPTSKSTTAPQKSATTKTPSKAATTATPAQQAPAAAKKPVDLYSDRK